MGHNRVAVPTHLFKVVLAEGEEKPALGVFIVPNKPIKDVDLGCIFHSELERDKVGHTIVAPCALGCLNCFRCRICALLMAVSWCHWKELPFLHLLGSKNHESEALGSLGTLGLEFWPDFVVCPPLALRFQLTVLELLILRDHCISMVE